METRTIRLAQTDLEYLDWLTTKRDDYYISYMMKVITLDIYIIKQNISYIYIYIYIYIYVCVCVCV